MSLRDAEMHTRLANAGGETKKIDSPTVEWLYPTQNGSPHRSGAPESNFGKKTLGFFSFAYTLPRTGALTGAVLRSRSNPPKTACSPSQGARENANSLRHTRRVARSVRVHP